MMTKVDFNDLELAFEFVSSGTPMLNEAYISRDTGKICWVSDDVQEEEPVPDDVGESGRYIAVPHKNDLDLGRQLVERFVREAMPDSIPQVNAMFRCKGAYARFKSLLDDKGQLDKWYRFEAAAKEAALCEWCAENGIEIVAPRNRWLAGGASAAPNIRAVMEQDAAAIAAIYNPYVRDTVISFEQTPVSDADMAQRIRDYTAHYPWLVATVDERVVAYAYATRWRARAAYDHALESTIYVAREHVGRGIAKPLYLALLAQLKSRGVHAVIGCIALPNEASVALHEKCGFVKVAHFPEVGRKFGRWVDVGFWQATLV